MYMKKLEALLQSDEHQLMRCALCSKLLAVKDRGNLVCSKAKLFIGFHGDVVAEHVPSASWDINKYLLDLRARKLSWRQVLVPASAAACSIASNHLHPCILAYLPLICRPLGDSANRRALCGMRCSRRVPE
jgi:hypothetical protein